MRDTHMQILNEWRNAAVRDGERIYVNSKGKKYVKSLTNTCMGCHTDKEKFCDRCHNTVGVAPYCWDCHNLSPNQKTPIPPAPTGDMLSRSLAPVKLCMRATARKTCKSSRLIIVSLMG